MENNKNSQIDWNYYSKPEIIDFELSVLKKQIDDNINKLDKSQSIILLFINFYFFVKFMININANHLLKEKWISVNNNLEFIYLKYFKNIINLKKYNEFDNFNDPKIINIMEYTYKLKKNIINFKFNINIDNFQISDDNYLAILDKLDYQQKEEYIKKYYSKIKILLNDYSRSVLCLNDLSIRNNKIHYANFLYNLNNSYFDEIKVQTREFIKITNKFDKKILNKNSHLKYFIDLLKYKKNLVNSHFTDIYSLLPHLLKILTNYFGYFFNINDNIKKWNNAVIIFDVFDNENILGNIYFDLLHNDHKTLISNVNIITPKINNQHPHIAIFDNIKSLSDKIITPIKGFKLFSHIATAIMLLSRNTSNNIYNQIEFPNILNSILFFIYFNDPSIKSLFGISSQFKTFQFLYLKNIAINSIFELCLFSSDDFIKQSKIEIKKDEHKLNLFIIDIFNQLVDTLDIPPIYKNKILNHKFIQKINKEPLRYFEKIKTFFASFYIYLFIKDFDNNNFGYEFRKLVIENNNHFIKNNINSFIQKFSITSDIDSLIQFIT